jgi:uncharacterized protein involved in type VI secretion and phage assembly
VTLLDDGLAGPSAPANGGGAGRWYGVFPALVTDIKDPDGQGRVKVALPWAHDPGGQRYEAWARLATMMGGAGRGSWFVPDVDDEVLVGFEGGDPRRPYVLGGLWNGSDSPPETMDGAGRNDKKVLHSRNGVKITLDDASGTESLTLETPGGQKLTLKDGPGSIELVDANGNSLKFDSSGITITTSSQLQVNASTATVTAGSVSVNAGTSIFSGLVRANSVVSPSIVGSTYTPGAGNIW